MNVLNYLPITSEVGEVDIHTWQDEEGKWWSCRTGEYRGLYSESDDVGPFDTEGEAIEAQKEEVEAMSLASEIHVEPLNDLSDMQE